MLKHSGLVLVLILQTSIVVAETSRSTLPISTEQICSALLAPYDTKQGFVRAKVLEIMDESAQLTVAGDHEAARQLLTEALEKKGWGRLRISEAQLLLSMGALNYDYLGMPEKAIEWDIAVYLRDGELQPCGGTHCAVHTEDFGRYLMDQGRYEDAIEVLETIDQCSIAFVEETEIKMMLSLFKIAVATGDESGAERRGNWLGEKLDQSTEADEKLREQIREALAGGIYD